MIDGKNISYVVHSGKCPKDKETNKLGKGAVFKCPACGATTEKKYIHDEFISQKNGADLMAIVAESKNGRIYLSPSKEHVKIAASAIPAWEPEEEMNTKCTDLVSGRGYGITLWKQLFTPRQLTALTTFSDLVAEAQAKAEADAIAAGLPDDGIGLADGGRGAKAYGQAVGVYLAFAVDQLANHSSSICGWNSPNAQMRAVFSRQAIPMTWDFAECNIFSNSTGSYHNLIERMLRGLSTFNLSNFGIAKQCNSMAECILNNLIISSDPPYYDNINYADLSDFFYIWMRRSLKNTYLELFRTMLVPKAEELVATPYRFEGNKQKAKEFFENGMEQVFARMQKAARNDVPVTIYYAFKQSETESIKDKSVSTGWETILSAILRAGFSITGTWPLNTEKPGRTLENGTNALASSIVLVCRKRQPGALAATRRQFLAELKNSLPQAVHKMQQANIAPVDLAQAAIGPGMEIYSRYAQVLEADGSPMNTRKALQAINAELDNYFNRQEGRLDEESRFCLELYSQYGFEELKFGEAEVLARAKNASLDKLAQMGAIIAQKGVVRILSREELPRKPKPDHLSDCLWLLTQYLVQAMALGGIMATARLAKEYAAGEARDLAYRLFSIAERQGWSKEAFDYNALVASWPEVMEKAAHMPHLNMEAGAL